ncbi:sugar ABC transporter ATP-binding protein [Pantoea sp. At-9b]|uniref:sugar ABC transporter ATP-binding protein n=1 Tax=Pantoea sp. (strain At-9b) TaxID=592316 RepID=UPI0001B40AAB|nr:sugar ABC transporter ATP-binding protein [Pantoea sp. At-9b]ADU72841.1 ABC transporter related protein [Pantoea sp. At-9b]
MHELLRLDHISKHYHGAQALDDVSFSLRAGEIHALLGENGAGKSTLSKIIAGVVTPEQGELRWEDRLIKFTSPADARQQGIAMVFQETSLIPSMTVAQNIWLGDEKTFNRLRGVYIAAQQFLQALNFPVDPTAQVATLGAAKRQMVEIARAVRLQARVIIFDEPTATLTPEEKQHFFALMRRLQQQGITLVFISHAIEEALQLADRITILRDGKHVITGDVRQFNRETIIAQMVGRPTAGVATTAPRVPRPAGEKILSVQDLSRGNVVRNNAFSLYRGQITGIFGLVGSGRTETARIIAGIDKRDFSRGGTIELNGQPVRYRVPRQAMKDGIVYVTEDRKSEGFFETSTIAENLYAGLLASEQHRSAFVSRRAQSALAELWRKRLNIRALNPQEPVVALSGGNQQKVVIGKSLVQQPQLIIFDEPTRGVDVGAIREIHQLINQLADDGLAVVVISSYLPEILALADRILVSRQGRIVEEFMADQADEKKIMYAAVH